MMCSVRKERAQGFDFLAVCAARKKLQQSSDRVHGFHDEIYGFEQAEQLFTSVKERQPQSEIRMVVFPTGDDNLAEDPDCKEKYFEELISWFMKYLKGETHDES